MIYLHSDLAIQHGYGVLIEAIEPNLYELKPTTTAGLLSFLAQFDCLQIITSSEGITVYAL
jgi:hypothetical protein